MGSSRPQHHVFEDRRYRLFGREGDVQALLERSREKGFTLVTGRPRMGKTWLLQEACRRLEMELGVLVGYFECPGGLTDVPLRAVADAYARWLSTATFKDQGQSLLERHRDSLIGRIGETVGGFLEKAIKGALDVPLSLGIENLFRSLAAADSDLKTGGLRLAALPYREARDLVSLLARLSGQDVVLIFDQWEKSDDWQSEAALLDTYLRHPDDWPGGHVFGVVRTDPGSSELIGEARRLVRQWPACHEHPLGAMDLAADEGRRMASHVRNILPAPIDGLDDARLVDLTDGYPGVLEQWSAPTTRRRLGTSEDLAATAGDAQANRFPELEAELERLLTEGDRAALTLAIRLALVPSFDRAEAWEQLKPIVFTSGEDGELVIDLQERGLLSQESLEFPSFGHETRREVTLSWAIERAPARTRQEAVRLITQAAGQVKSTEDQRGIIPAQTVLEVFNRAEGLGLGSGCQVFFESCRSLAPLGDQATFETMQGAVTKIEAIEEAASVAPLVAMGLFNTLIAAKEEEDLAWRDALLDELRALATAHPDDPAVREHLSGGLVNTLMSAKFEKDLTRGDALLEELRALKAAHPEDPAMRRQLAKGLVNRAAQLAEVGQVECCAGVVSELREIVATGEDPETIRSALSLGATFLWRLYEEGNEKDKQAALLEELAPLGITDGQIQEVLSALDATE